LDEKMSDLQQLVLYLSKGVIKKMSTIFADQVAELKEELTAVITAEAAQVAEAVTALKAAVVTLEEAIAALKDNSTTNEDAIAALEDLQQGLVDAVTNIYTPPAE
jgi:hypothetical protein